MRVMIITSSPNKEGLTAACGKAAKWGVEEAKGEPIMVNLNDLNITRCNVCENGWGTCRERHVCQGQDDFEELHQSIRNVDALIAVTPVYWGEMSEPAKAFFDRLRRCEAFNRENSILEGKQVISIAAAGGSGNGTINCLSSMERLFAHMRAERFDLIGITQSNRGYMLKAIQQAAREMVNKILCVG